MNLILDMKCPCSRSEPEIRLLQTVNTEQFNSVILASKHATGIRYSSLSNSCLNVAYIKTTSKTVDGIKELTNISSVLSQQ